MVGRSAMQHGVAFSGAESGRRISAAALERRVAYTPWHRGASGLGVKYLSVRSPKGFPGGRDRVACQDSL